MRILIIEDEKDLANAINKGLKILGYAADIALTGSEGEQKALVTEYDLILLDLNLPDMDGIEVCKVLREKGCQSSILMLTARNSLDDKTSGLDSGADDYLTKPFAFEELRARIQALVRRAYGVKNPVIRIGDFVIDPAVRSVTYRKNKIDLTGHEFDILEYMAHSYPSVVSIEEIMEHTWNDEINPFSNVARVHLANLRRKLKEEAGKSLIETVIGKGYRICEE